MDLVDYVLESYEYFREQGAEGALQLSGPTGISAASPRRTRPSQSRVRGRRDPRENFPTTGDRGSVSPAPGAPGCEGAVGLKTVSAESLPSRCPEHAAHTPPPASSSCRARQGRALAPSRPTSSTRRRGEPQLVPCCQAPGYGSGPRAQAAPETPGEADTRATSGFKKGLPGPKLTQETGQPRSRRQDPGGPKTSPTDRSSLRGDRSPERRDPSATAALEPRPPGQQSISIEASPGHPTSHSDTQRSSKKPRTGAIVTHCRSPRTPPHKELTCSGPRPTRLSNPGAAGSPLHPLRSRHSLLCPRKQRSRIPTCLYTLSEQREMLVCL
ncbi:hypothetical protein NDU88_002479 [Pleurodeles waltl]|uniref:Uncharacterized protein n=1 Tax=Pleurodeles waltl TaxID=8319 RepID=A0AAV7PA37_PLEWA|nr:hypothetical protein NDU88_002479 [Pleurodeles waltl]